MLKNYKNIILNSSLLFVVASILVMTLHESGHFLMAIFLHAQKISLYHNNVVYNQKIAPLWAQLLIAAAGPLVSLFSGIIFHFLCKKRRKRDLLFLFSLYMSSFGFIGFFGYLLVTPFFTSGDTGFIAKALNFPLWLTVAIALVAAISLFLIFKNVTKYFVELATPEIINNKKERSIFVTSIIGIPLFIGIVITTILNLPVPSFLSLIYPLCSPFTFLWAYGDAFVKKYDIGNVNINSIHTINYSLFVLLAIIIVLNRLLVYGIHVN